MLYGTWMVQVKYNHWHESWCLTWITLNSLDLFLLVRIGSAPVVVVLERHGEGDDDDGQAPADHEVAHVGEHSISFDSEGHNRVNVNAFHNEKGEGGRVEEVNADAEVATEGLDEYINVIRQV